MAIDPDTVSAMKSIQENCNRSKNLSNYNRILEFPHFFNRSLVDILSHKTTSEFSWADFGSGNQIALREASYYFGSRNFKTYAVDMLELDSEKQILDDLNRSLFPWSSKELCSYESDSVVVSKLFKPEYDPLFFNDDIADVVLPEKVDLITSAWVFQYIENVLPAIDNAYSQLKEGGSFLFNTHIDKIPFEPSYFCDMLETNYNARTMLDYGEIYCCCEK
ncbi:MAG: hypothetical protein ACQESC_03825 [Nanobdellota archaeon]